MGWSLPVRAIERMTARGLPAYTTADAFATESGEELVHNPADGTYRARYEGGFVRYRWVDAAGQGRGGYWTAEYPDGRVGYFGASRNGTLVPAARLMDGAGKTFRYYLVEEVDASGHAIAYRYTQASPCPSLVAPASATYEPVCEPLLSRVEWVESAASPGGYRYAATLAYEPRDDELSNAKPGFDARVVSRLKSLHVLVRGEEVRRYELAYEDPLVSWGLSRLSRIETYGAGGAGPYPVRFGFAYTGDISVQVPYLRIAGSVGVDFATGDADLADIDGDGLPDVVHTPVGGRHRFYFNRMDDYGRHTWTLPAESAAAASPQLSNDGVWMADLDGNGFADMVSVPGRTILWNPGAGDWTPAPLALDERFPSPTTNGNIRFFDYDHDKRIDVMQASAGNTVYRLSDGTGGFGTVVNDGEPLAALFSDGAVLADMNGDGLQDVARYVRGAVSYRSISAPAASAPGRRCFYRGGRRRAWSSPTSTAMA